MNIQMFRNLFEIKTVTTNQNLDYHDDGGEIYISTSIKNIEFGFCNI